MARIIDAFTQFFDSAGDPLVNGKLHFLVSGTNNTDKNTYKDAGMTIPNTNPVILDGDGRCSSVFGEGVYNVILYTSDGTQIQQFDPVGANSVDGQFSPWTANNTYNSGDIAQGSDSEYYRSITNNNQNNNPETSATNWELLKLGRVYNDNISYSNGDSVYSTDGVLYTSLVDSNLANTPQSSPDEWIASNAIYYANAGGTVDAITADFPIDAEFIDGMVVIVTASGANETATPTFSQDGDAARTITKFGGLPLLVGDIYGSGHKLLLSANTDDDTWELLNPNISGLGVGQTQQDLIASRSVDTIYTNTTGKPILVMINYGQGAGSDGSIEVAGVEVLTVKSTGVATAYTFIVQNGESYILNTGSGARTLSSWSELR